MGQKRKDRTMEEWMSHGNKLLTMMGSEHKLYREIDSLLSKLMSKNKDINKQALILSLNSHKYELDYLWRKWTQKIKQELKDANRTKFYIDKKIYNDILGFIGFGNINSKLEDNEKWGEKNKISDNKIFKTLFYHISSFGVGNVKEMYDLIDELNKFGSASSERYSKDALTSESKGYKGETGKIIYAIIEELKRNRITNFEKLKKIRSNVNRELNDTNKLLSDENEKLKRRIRELELELEPPLDID